MTSPAPGVPPGTKTPVGDWLRKRYPPNPGATHYLGTGDDPGCCAGPHPACTYDAGFREGAAAEREALSASMAKAASETIAQRDAWWQQRLSDAVAVERERCAVLAGRHWCDCAADLAALIRQEHP